MEEVLDARAFATEDGVDPGDAAIAEAAKTDACAFGELYERYYPRVYRYSYHRLGNAADAEDVAAVVFMKAIEGLPSYQPTRNSFAPWLFRITRNVVIDFYRRRRHQSQLEDLDHRSDQGDPVMEALGNEQREELRRLVRHLSDEQRDVVLMRYAADLSFTEIAEVLKKKEPAVRMLLHRGLRKLKAVMEDA